MLCTSMRIATDRTLPLTCMDRIDAQGFIKISDFGLSKELDSKTYYRLSEVEGEVKLPVRWMAPESIGERVFSEKTDVVW